MDPQEPALVLVVLVLGKNEAVGCENHETIVSGMGIKATRMLVIYFDKVSYKTASKLLRVSETTRWRAFTSCPDEDMKQQIISRVRRIK